MSQEVADQLGLLNGSLLGGGLLNGNGSKCRSVSLLSQKPGKKRVRKAVPIRRKGDEESVAAASWQGVDGMMEVISSTRPETKM